MVGSSSAESYVLHRAKATGAAGAAASAAGFEGFV
jgi:hypothetical protein